MRLTTLSTQNIALHRSLPWCAINSSNPKLLRPYLEVVNYLHKTFATYEAVAEYDASILGYMELLSLTRH